MESNGAPGIVGSIKDAAPIVCAASKATTSCGAKPASLNRARMALTESVGSGIVPSAAGLIGGGRPSIYSSRGAPAQLEIPTAAARWMLILKRFY